MAFPTRESVTATQFSTASTTHNVSMPGTVSSGDLLFIIFSIEGDTTFTTPSGWTSEYVTDVNSGGGVTQGRGALYSRVADGTEGSTTVNVATGSAAEACAQTYRLSSWFGSAAGIEAATPVTTTTTNSPNPPSFSPSWGAEDTMWIPVVHSADDDEDATSAPTNYINLVSTISGAGTNNGCGIGSATRNLNASSEDPGTFSLTASEAVATSTIAVRPAAGGGPSSEPYYLGGNPLRRQPRGFGWARQQSGLLIPAYSERIGQREAA